MVPGRRAAAHRRTGARRRQTPVTKRTKQRVTLDQLDGVWLPAADRPASVTAQGLKLAVDPTSGAVATGSGLHPGLTYQVESQVPTYDPDRLQYLAAASDPAYAQLPDLDAASEPIPMVEEFRKIADKATQGSQFPYQQALKLADWLRASGTATTSPRCPATRTATCGSSLESSKEGTSEQFASAFAVLGRSLGLPTRVVVGFSQAPSCRTGRGAWTAATWSPGRRWSSSRSAGCRSTRRPARQAGPAAPRTTRPRWSRRPPRRRPPRRRRRAPTRTATSPRSSVPRAW
ncbi:DUF3488 and transglutaminase-like domain-containing protein [Yinghuangia aomiensis]